MKAVFKIIIGVLATILVGVLSIPFDILPGSAVTAQSSLQDRVDQLLATGDYPWMAVTIDGQKAVVTGDAPSHEDHEFALTSIGKAAWSGGVVVGGVTAVDHARLSDPADLPPTDRFVWIAERQADAVVLSGFAPSQTARIEVFQRAREIFPGAEISGELDLASGGPLEADWLMAASTSLRALARLESGAIEAEGSQFVLTGVANSAERADVLRALMATLPTGMNGIANLSVIPSAAAPAPTPSAPAIAAPSDVGAEVAIPTLDTEIPPAANTDPVAAPVAQALADACRNRLRDKIAERNIGFSTGSANLVAASRSYLLELAAVMTECPQFSYEIIGHTDSTGSQSRNLRLSQRRAESVQRVLMDGGAPAQRLVALGRGEAEPIADNATADGRRRNRRIDIDLIFDPQ